MKESCSTTPPAVEVYEPRSDYEFGLIAGRERPGLYRLLVSGVLTLWKRYREMRPGPQPSPRAHRRIAGDLYPAGIERIAGLAKATGLDEDDLLTGSGIIGGLLTPRCTDFAAAPPATGDGGVYVSWNVDICYLLKLVLGRNALFVVRIPDRKPYVAFGVPALLGLGCLNCDGLAMAGNAVGMTDGGEGLNAAELNNMAMESCSTVNEVVELYRSHPRETFVGNTVTILMNMNSTWVDRDGGTATIEYSHNHIAVRKDERGILAEANHHQYLDHELSGGVDPGQQRAIAGSYARLARMWELLEQHHGAITPEVGRRIVSDHGTNYSLLEPWGITRPWYDGPIDDGTICAHYWNTWEHVRRGEFLDAFEILATSCTVYQMIFSPRALSVYYCCGWPCRNPHRPLYFGSLLDAEPASPELAAGTVAPRARMRAARPFAATFGWPREGPRGDLMRSIRKKVEGLDRLIQ